MKGGMKGGWGASSAIRRYACIAATHLIPAVLEPHLTQNSFDTGLFGLGRDVGVDPEAGHVGEVLARSELVKEHLTRIQPTVSTRCGEVRVRRNTVISRAGHLILRHVGQNAVELFRPGDSVERNVAAKTSVPARNLTERFCQRRKGP